MEDIIDIAFKIENSILTKSLQLRLFKSQLEDNNVENTYFLLHTNVRWHKIVLMINSPLRWFKPPSTIYLEIVTRTFLFVVFLELEQTSPFKRKIHMEEIWLYKNPRTSSYVPTNFLFTFIFLIPTVALFTNFLIQKNKSELCQGLMSFSLALGLNGVITDVIKIIVGRPRPDFFYRCFPDGNMGLENISDISLACKGEEAEVLEGRKSFPSGHASFSFCSFGFLSLWLCGKIGVFRSKGNNGWKLVIGGLPLFIALIIALSRTCDYHHHWQDVLVGSLIGGFIAYLCYRQYYPRLSSSFCPWSHSLVPSLEPNALNTTVSSRLSPLTSRKTDIDFNDPESLVEEQIKWI